MKSVPLLIDQVHLVYDLNTLGELIRSHRSLLGLRLIDVAAGVGVSTSVLSRLESGKAIRADSLFKVLYGLGLTMGVQAQDSVSFELGAAEHSNDWYGINRGQSPTIGPPPLVEPVMDRTTPTLFLNFDGTLHVGHGVMRDGVVSLDTQREVFEFAPLLAELLRPYPLVKIVLTTDWLRIITLDEVIFCMPSELACRVEGSTQDLKQRLSSEQSDAGRIDVIISYAHDKRLKNWLAIDDKAFGAYKFGYGPGALVDHFLLVNPEHGISDVSAHAHIQRWLESVHQPET